MDEIYDIVKNQLYIINEMWFISEMKYLLFVIV